MKRVDKDYLPSELEEGIRDYWREVDAYRKTIGHRASGEPFSFLDGPPYTTGSVHVGTAWNKILKDLFIRYRRMRGYNVRDQPGYDMHGLPIEVRVEQTIGTKNKQDIETFGVEKFVETCKKYAVEYRDKQTEEFSRLGVWMAWERPYQTIDRSYISSVWWTLGQADKKSLLSKSERVLPWCPRCETALAEAEIEYWDETDPSVYVKLPLEEIDGESIIVWTTTPWTIPGNIAAAVHPDEAYARVKVKGPQGPEILIVMKGLVDEALPAMGYPEYELIDEVIGRDLTGKKYRHPLRDLVPYHETVTGEHVHSIVVSDTVAKENTGVVHIAPGHGPEDFEIGRQFNLPVFCPVDGEGRFTSAAGERYAGKPVHDGGKMVLDDLQDRNCLVKEDTITHRYGHCWRCKTPVIYLTTEQWFLRVPEMRDQIQSSNEAVTWYPEWAGSSRQRDWIGNAREWCISRQRYWGTPMPIWTCECGETRVVSGYEELREAEGFKEGLDPHRPWIDELKFKCAKCGGMMTRVRDVMDVWFDSGVCSWAQLAYPEKREEFERWWPVDWITEAHDQTRGWFYSQLVLGTLAFQKSPFKSVLMHGWALDQEGRPMSKSEGTAVDPMEIIKLQGADSLRLYLLGAGAPWDDLAFQPEGPKLARRSLNILWNVYKFASLYMSLDAFDPKKELLKFHMSTLKPEDRWILSRLEGVKEEVTSHLDRYEPHEAERRIERFVTEELSRWYVRLVRDRLWIEGESTDKATAFAVLHRCLLDAVLMLAPFAPFITEEMYRNLDGHLPSVHMMDWPRADRGLKDDSIEQVMETVRDIVEKVSKIRQDAQLNLRWPLKRIVLKADSEEMLEALKSLEEIILEQANVKSMEIIPVGEEWDEMILTVVPNPNAIGKVYRQWSSKIAVLLKSRPAKSIKEGVDKGEYSLGIEGQLVKILPNMVSFTSSFPPDVEAAEFSRGVVYADLEMTESLEAEGYARELVRRIQQMRKDMQLDVEEFVGVDLTCGPKLEEYLTEWSSYIRRETRAKEIRFGGTPKGEYIVEWNIAGETVSIGLSNLRVKESVGEIGQIPGISLEKAKSLFDAGFGTLQSLAEAPDSRILAVTGIEREDIAKVRSYLAELYAAREAVASAPAPPPSQVSAAGQPALAREVVPKAVPAGHEAEAAARPGEPEAAEAGAARAAPGAAALEKTFTYLVEEEKPETSYRLFVQMMGSGMQGLCVTRNYPAKIKSRFHLGDTPVIWLSNVGRESTIRPKDLEKLSLSLEQFLANKEVIVLLDGLEYLITNNNFITVLRLIQSLRDQVAINQSILLLAVNPSTLESHQLNLLEREVDGTISG